MILDWLIIGGGVHGVHLAARLIGEGEISPAALAILDPADQLLARWRACTATTGMTHLRSPAVHHIGLDPWALHRLGGKRRQQKQRPFAPPYQRPSLALFNRHCDQVIRRHGLDARHIRDRAARCEVDAGGVTVQTAEGRQITARHVLLAIGASEQPRWPEWAPRAHGRIRHVFEVGFDSWPSPEASVAVIGGGISAGQIALRALDMAREVHLISRHPLRQHQFDSDPGWLGPKHMAGFSREPDPDRRRAIISAARHSGSVPPDVRRALRHATERRDLRWREADVQRLEASADGPTRLHLSNGECVEVDHVLLATGFDAARPGGQMLDGLIEGAGLPCAQCGYPIVGADLRWHPRVHVTGPLAELALGPVSRNIAGARRAGDRIISALR